MTLSVDKFLPRFLLYLLPQGFVCIRNFGFLANRNRATLLSLWLRLLGGSREDTATPTLPSTDQAHSLWNCPVCGGTMRVVERLSAAQLLLRSPPQPDRPQHEVIFASSVTARASASTQIPCLIWSGLLGRLSLQPSTDASVRFSRNHRAVEAAHSTQLGGCLILPHPLRSIQSI